MTAGSSTPFRRRVAIVTCRVLPEPDPDQDLLLDRLGEAGLDARLLGWDDPDAPPPGEFELCVLRSSWNYPRAPEAFLAWCAGAAAASRLANPLEAVRWNLHKRYLRELEAAGVPTVPTAWVERGERPELERIADDRGWDDVVVKPAISAASFRTRRFARSGGNGAARPGLAEGARFLAELSAERDAMVQPYLPAVEEPGERSLVWIDGELTHAVCKKARWSGEDEEVSEALPVAAADRELAETALFHVLERVSPELLYARIDLVDDGGSPRLSELELIEPSLFLLQEPRALDRLSAAIGARAAAAVTSP